MRKFLQKALERIEKLDREKIRNLLAEVAEENELLEMVLESMTDGVVVTDRQHRTLLLNKSSQRMLPLASEELPEKSFWEAIRDREIAEFFRQNLSNQEKVIDQEFTIGDGQARILACSLLPLVREGEIQGNLIHIEDVTEKREKEARLRRAESLAALTTLTAGVAHEIKNPLASISIHLQLIKKLIAGRQRVQTEKITENLEVIHEEVERLNRIVVDFLFAVRPMDISLEPGDLNRVVRELIEFMKLELDQHRIAVELRLVDPGPQIRLDERYMKQALLNMVKNAISAMPEGGTLTIETICGDHDLLLKVSDTGVGISEQIIGKIFEPYFTTKEFGSGLGLTLVYKIVKGHRGEISVASKLGEGTTFVFSFPIFQKEKRLIAYEEDKP